MQEEDADLVIRSKQGDLFAFNRIVQRYESQVHNVAARIIGDRGAAEDVAQETFISAHRAIGRFRGGSLRAWLLRIASNQSYDHIRAARRRPEQPLDEAVLNRGNSLPSGETSPEQMALGRELRDEIQRAIASLPFDQRTALVLVDIQGLSYRETAEATSVSLGTVKSRLSRARHGVRDILLQHADILPEQFRQRR